MKRVKSVEDEMSGFFTYDLGDGRFLKVTQEEVFTFGLETVLRHYGVEPSTERVPVFQNGREIGSFPACFEPGAVRSSSPLYAIRNGDFERDGDRWVASRDLGPSDFEAVPGFCWSHT